MTDTSDMDDAPTPIQNLTIADPPNADPPKLALNLAVQTATREVDITGTFLGSPVTLHGNLRDGLMWRDSNGTLRVYLKNGKEVWADANGMDRARGGGVYNKSNCAGTLVYP